MTSISTTKFPSPFVQSRADLYDFDLGELPYDIRK